MGHGHAHGHSHGHGHGHAAASEGADFGRAFLIGIVLNLGFVALEAAYGLHSESTALIADAAHNLSDVLGLALAWGASSLAKRPASDRHTYGLRRSTVLAALANAILLVTAVGAVLREAIGRFATPGEPEGVTMMAVAAAGVVVNGMSALLFSRGRHGDANIRGAFLHLAADAAVSAGVVIAGLILWKTGLAWVDPLTSILISIVVLVGTWQLLRDALHLALDGVPSQIRIAEVRGFLESLPTVEGVHDLHVWAMSTTEIALTAHLVVAWPDAPPPFFASLEHELETRFGIAHATVQLEPTGERVCGRAIDGCV